MVHTGQNYDYELNQVFFDDLDCAPPDHYLGAAGDTAADTSGKSSSRSTASWARSGRRRC